MADTPIQFWAPSNMTLTMELYPFGSDTIANGLGGDSATEKTNAKGLYEITVDQNITGLHNATIFDPESDVIGVYTVNIRANDTTIYRCSDDVYGQVALPDAAPQAAGGLPLTISGNLDLDDMEATVDRIEEDTQDIQSRLPAVLVSGRMDSHTGSMAQDVQDEIADSYLDRADAIEAGVTPRKAHRAGLAANAGKTNGAGSANFNIRDTNDTKNVIEAIVDSKGNRNSITLDLD